MLDNGEPQRLGTYVLLNKLGEGGMGAVYKAHDPALDRDVALKLLPPHLAGDPDFVTRFKREATAAAKLTHPNVVQVYTAGEDIGTHYIAMEFVEGESVHKRIQRTGRLDCNEALAIAIYAAEALRYAWNEARLIHRDIKPGNILLSNDGKVKIADLGLAKTVQTAATDFTSTGTVMGSPHYISPEQARGDKDVDFRSDIYSLGCTLYHMLAGRLPYEADTPMSVMYKHVNDPPPDLLQVWPECPPHVAAFLKRMMAKDRSKRPSNYDELIAELNRLYKEARQAAIEHAAARTCVHKPVTEKKKLAMIVGIAGAVAGVVGLLLWSPWQSREKKVGGASAPRPPVQEQPGRGSEAAPTLAALRDNLTVNLGGGVKMDFVLIRPGTFTMGSHDVSNATPHKVTLTTPFYLGKFEVTQEQWQAVMGSNPSKFKGAKNPVEQVSWDDCQTFIRKLKEKMPGQTFRLPTEAEWEYACRAGSSTKYCYDDDEDGLGEYAWYDGNAGNTTHPVGEKKPNAWGLYDILGNVQEWCADWYGDYDSSAVTDPVGPSSASYRVLRGGSWFSGTTGCRSARRYNCSPSFCNISCGLRVVVDVSGARISTPSTSSATATRVSALTQPKAGDGLALDLGGGVTMDFVLIRPGTFTMGSEFTYPDGNAKPMHKVTITKLFYLGKFEVTQEQWEAVMGSNPSKFKGAKNPVTSVSWEDCQTFLQKLQEKVPGQTLRLPTEAEWEYACRAGSASEYCYGDGDGRLGEYAWYDSNSDKMAHSVGEKKPNAWGLYDMHGNVAEWCVDWFEKYDSSVATDPVGPATGSKRVMRGASWFNPATDCQSAIRRAYDPSRRNIASGLRVVMEAR